MKLSVLLTALLFVNIQLMAKEIKTEIIIKASPEKVWSILNDFDSYSQWNPFIKSIRGSMQTGNKVQVHLAPANSKGMKFKAKILTYQPQKQISWIGHFLFPGLFDGKHLFEIIDNKDGTVTFKQSEKFTGILVPLFSKQLDTGTKAGFEEMNKQLKKIAES